MIKTKITIPEKARLLAKIKSKLIDKETVDKLNEEAVEEVKRFMAAGTSPVKNKRRFPAYKDKNKYPGKLKASRPVNLFLSGRLYESLIAAKTSAMSFYIGISSLAEEEVKVYAKANNLGENKIPARRFIPIKGEQFNVSIMRKIKDIIARRLAELIKS